MLKNNIEMDVKMRCIEKSTTQAKIAENIGTSPSYVNKIVRSKEQIMNKSFLAMMEDLGLMWNCIMWRGRNDVQRNETL